MFKMASVALIFVVGFFSLNSVAVPQDTAAVCGADISSYDCDQKKLKEFKKITKDTIGVDVTSYSEAQKVFFKSVADHCHLLPDTCNELINWQRGPASEKSAPPAGVQLGWWGIAFTLIGLYLLYKLFVKGMGLAFSGIARAWSFFDITQGVDIRNTEHARRVREKLNSGNSNPDYFDGQKSHIDFGFGPSSGASSQRSDNSAHETKAKLWRVEGYYRDQKSYEQHFQIVADSADEARSKVSKDKKDFVILRVSVY